MMDETKMQQSQIHQQFGLANLIVANTKNRNVNLKGWEKNFSNQRV
jgi:hypothetical protein